MVIGDNTNRKGGMTMQRTRDEQIEIANTIISQLGGRKFIVMTGAKDIFAHPDGVSFKIPGTMTKQHINYLKIALDPNDTYTMCFHRIRGTRAIPIAEHSMVYHDQLQSIFTAETGLDTRL